MRTQHNSARKKTFTANIYTCINSPFPGDGIRRPLPCAADAHEFCAIAPYKILFIKERTRKVTFVLTLENNSISCLPDLLWRLATVWIVCLCNVRLKTVVHVWFMCDVRGDKRRQCASLLTIP